MMAAGRKTRTDRARPPRGGPRSDIRPQGPGAEARPKAWGYPPAIRAAWPSSTPSPPGSGALRRDLLTLPAAVEMRRPGEHTRRASSNTAFAGVIAKTTRPRTFRSWACPTRWQPLAGLPVHARGAGRLDDDPDAPVVRAPVRHRVVADGTARSHP